MGLILTKKNHNKKNEGILFQLPLDIIYKIIEFALSNSRYKQYYLKYSNLNKQNKIIKIYRPFFNIRLINKYWYIFMNLTECQFCRPGKYLFISKFKSNLKCNNCGHIFRERKYYTFDLLDDPNKNFISIRKQRLIKYKYTIFKKKETYYQKEEYIKRRKNLKKCVKYRGVSDDIYKIY
jgi:hypothetical protein